MPLWPRTRKNGGSKFRCLSSDTLLPKFLRLSSGTAFLQAPRHPKSLQPGRTRHAQRRMQQSSNLPPKVRQLLPSLHWWHHRVSLCCFKTQTVMLQGRRGGFWRGLSHLMFRKSPKQQTAKKLQPNLSKQSKVGCLCYSLEGTIIAAFTQMQKQATRLSMCLSALMKSLLHDSNCKPWFCSQDVSKGF